MKGLPLEIILNTVGKEKLREPLKSTVTIPIPENRTPNGWGSHFATPWPKGKDLMLQPEYDDVIMEGLKVLARRAKVKTMLDDYKRAHPETTNGKRGRKASMELVDLKTK